MFNNLIESSSHRSEFKRRGSFFLFTTATYALLFVIAGVVSIYAYDARLTEQSTTLTMLTFAPPEPAREVATVPQRSHADNPSRNNSNVVRPTRPVLIDRPDNPANPPDQIGIKASIPPAPRYAIGGPQVLDPPGSGRYGKGSDQGASYGSGGTPIIDAGIPPPAPKPSPQRIIASPTVLNSKALDLPKPPYPPMAKELHIQGIVSVQVLIDETGKVVSAKAVSGNLFLIPEAQKAAYRARFSPTFVGDQPVKVSGTITYNFVLQ
jgi:periplasmic protein TonB